MLEQYRWQTFFKNIWERWRNIARRGCCPPARTLPMATMATSGQRGDDRGLKPLLHFQSVRILFLTDGIKMKMATPIPKTVTHYHSTTSYQYECRIPFKNIWFIIWFWETRVWKSMTIRDNEKIWLQAWGQSLLHHWWEFFSTPRASTNCRGLSGQLTTNLYNCNQTFQRHWWNKRLVSNGGSAEIFRSSNQ